MLLAILLVCAVTGYTYGAAPPCKKDEFTCTNGECIPSDWMCDDMPDCTDGSDEKQCVSDCEGHKCDGGTKCISLHHTCNCRTDCDDETDEDFIMCGFNQSPNPRDCATCSMNGLGDITTVTWDKADIVYRGTLPCEILLAQTAEGIRPGFRVAAIASMVNGQKFMSTVLISIYHKTGGITKLILQRGGVIMVNGKRLPLGEVIKKPGGVKVPFHSNLIIRHRDATKTTLVDYDDKYRFMYRTEGSVEKHHINLLQFTKEHEKQMIGLCGNYNGNPRDDYMAKDGTTFLLNRDEILNSWVLGECPDVAAINAD